MPLTQEQIAAIAHVVSVSRMQEYICVSLYTVYVFYIFMTTEEEVSSIFPQKWGIGKILFLVIRYGIILTISLELALDYRSYFVISPKVCDALPILMIASQYAAHFACDISLGLCISALVQLRMRYTIPLTITCVIPNALGFIFMIVSQIQSRAEPPSSLNRELGYPCQSYSTEQFSNSTIFRLGRDIRSYIAVVISAFLVVLVVTTLVVRYKANKGRLVQVIRRDGIAFYAFLAAMRCGTAIVNTPGVVPVDAWDTSPALVLVRISNLVVVPMLAQQLLLNIRKVDYIGSHPVASKLLFAQASPGSDDETDSFEFNARRTGPASGTDVRDAGRSA